ncbi:MAG: hypothetical protein KC656_30335, partial [Myxococcales bacterium]|nr:hypothetical protein [Myxococcales bacterium]
MSPRPFVFLLFLAAPVASSVEPDAQASGETCIIRGSVTTRGKPRGPVMVYVLGDGPPATAPTSGVIGQRNKAFDADALIVSSGAEVAFPNRDA